MNSVIMPGYLQCMFNGLQSISIQRDHDRATRCLLFKNEEQPLHIEVYCESCFDTVKDLNKIWKEIPIEEGQAILLMGAVINQ